MSMLQHEADLVLLLVLGVSSIFCTEFVLRQNLPATVLNCHLQFNIKTGI